MIDEECDEILKCTFCGKLCNEVTMYSDMYSDFNDPDEIREEQLLDENQYCDSCFDENEKIYEQKRKELTEK